MHLITTSMSIHLKEILVSSVTIQSIDTEGLLKVMVYNTLRHMMMH